MLGLAIPATLALLIAIVNLSPRFQKSNLRDPLKQRLRSKGVDVDKWGGLYVGLAPGVAPRFFESVGFWDIGFLFFSSDRLYYWGEESQFMLRRDQITDVRLGPGEPSFVKSSQVYVAWRDEDRGGCGVFNFGCRGANTNSADSEATIALSNRIMAWRASTMSTSAGLPAPLDSLSSPSFRAVTAAVPGMKVRSKKFYNEVVITGWIAAFAAMLFGLQFHFFPYLTGSVSKLRAMPSYHSPGMGWYVVAAAITIRILLMIPVLRYKDTPVLVAKDPVNKGKIPPAEDASALSASGTPTTSAPDPVPAR